MGDRAYEKDPCSQGKEVRIYHVGNGEPWMVLE